MLAYVAVKRLVSLYVSQLLELLAFIRIHFGSVAIYIVFSTFSLFSAICRSQFTVEDCFMQIT